MADSKSSLHPIDSLVQRGRYEEAIHLGQTLLGRHPKNTLVRLKLAFIFAGLEMFEEAWEQIGNAEKGPADNLWLTYLLKGRLEYYLDDRNHVNSFRRAIELQPRQRQFVYYLADHKLRGDYVILKDLQLIYSPIPKSGTTTVKKILAKTRLGDNKSWQKKALRQLVKGAGIEPVIEYFSPEETPIRPHTQINNKRFEKDRLRLGSTALDKFYKFAIVRGDIERFESYARKNVIETTCLVRPSGGQDEYFGLPTRPDIDRLAHSLKKYQFLFLDVIHHTIPERAYLHRDLDFYDEVFKLKDIELLQNELARRLDVDMTFDREKKSSNQVRKIKLNDTSRDTLRSYYESSLT